MKPLILKTHEGLYLCEIPIENEPEDEATDAEWWTWAATGVGSSPVEAYKDWLEECRGSLEVYDVS